MEWRDEAIVLGIKHHGENSVIVELLTKAHGRHSGLVRSGRSKQMRPVLQAGNSVDCLWRARLEEHLGNFTLEGTRLRAASFMESALALHGVNLLSALLRLLPERDPQIEIYEAAEIILNHVETPEIIPALLVRLELAILTELGFGLDLSTCAVTAEPGDLVYVSPKSGRAVSRTAGAAWHDRLLTLPAFLSAEGTSPNPQDVIAGFMLTGFFLERNVYLPRGQMVPDARRALLACLSPAA